MNLIRIILRFTIPRIDYSVNIQGFRLKIRSYVFLGLFRKKKWATNPLPEKGVRLGIDKYLSTGMSVVQVGGGSGITSLHTLRSIGENGFLTIYEGGKESIRVTDLNLTNNNFNNYKIIQAIVGDEKNVYGGNTLKSLFVHPKDLPNCDYLELDCEGSEKSILENMRINPKFIVVEVHPKLIGEDVKWLEEFLINNNYRVDYYSGHDGNTMTRNEFLELYKFNLRTGENRLDGIQGRAPMVVGLIKMS